MSEKEKLDLIIKSLNEVIIARKNFEKELKIANKLRSEGDR